LSADHPLAQLLKQLPVDRHAAVGIQVNEHLVI
jgi:hypothetical protein